MGEVGRLNLLRGEKEKGLYMINHRQKDNVLAPWCGYSSRTATKFTEWDGGKCPKRRPMDRTEDVALGGRPRLRRDHVERERRGH